MTTMIVINSTFAQIIVFCFDYVRGVLFDNVSAEFTVEQDCITYIEKCI